MLSYSSLVNRGKLTLPSVDTWGTNNNIKRDPPKSIMTRRVDKVSDTNQIVKMVDNCDRSNDAILRFARGVNPSVSVSYSNNGGSLQNFGNQQSFLPYRINKDGDFHPPVQAPLDLLPLSRLKYNNVQVITTPSLPHYTKELDNSRNVTANRTVKQEIISSSVKTPQTYALQKPFQEPFEVKYNINENVLKVSGDSGKIAFSDRTIQNNVVPTKVIQMDAMNVNVETNKQDMNYHKIETDMDFSKIKTQDVMLIEYQSTKKGNDKYELVHENFELERNIPEYDAFSNIKMSGDKFTMNIHNDIELGRNIPEYQLYSNKNVLGKNHIIAMNEIELERNLPEYQLYSNKNDVGKRTNNITPVNDIILERNIPEYNVTSMASSGVKSKISYIHDDIVLGRNVPEHETTSNTSGNQKIEYIHSDIELDRVLPGHEATTNISQNMRKTLLHNKMKEYERKAILSQMSTNDSKKGEINSNNAKAYNKLQEKIQPGEFVNSGFVPTVGRTQEMNVRMGENSKNLRVRRE